MDDSGLVWQCKCGHIEHTDTIPQDCPKCFRVGKFECIPEDKIIEKTEEAILSMNGDEDED